eukprot:jgi/Mesen1/4290/ME000022S03571
MASIMRLETISGPGETSHYSGSRNVGGSYAAAPLDRASSFRSSGEESRGHAPPPSSNHPLWGGANNASFVGDISPLAQILSLEDLTTGENRWPKCSELDSAMAYAVGEELAPPGVRPQAVFSVEERRRLLAGLKEGRERARDRRLHLSEALTKLDKWMSSVNSKKRPKPEGASFERPVGGGPKAPERLPSAGTVLKSASAGAGGGGEGSRAGDKLKAGGAPNKRPRTGAGEVRDGGRPSSLQAHQKSWGGPEKGSPRGSASLPSPGSGGGGGGGEDRERAERLPPPALTPAVSDGADLKNKMKGKRKEHKWANSAHRLSFEGRPRPSEGHGFRSGPVHGVTSAHKAEAAARMGSSLAHRSGDLTKLDLDACAVGALRDAALDRERGSPKDSSARPRESAALPSPATITKGKATRGHRASSTIGGANSLSHLGRSGSGRAAAATAAPGGESAPRERPEGSKKLQPYGGSERKRSASSRSPSPPRTQWVGQRPQKMARVARAGVVAPPTKEDGNEAAEGSLHSGASNGPASGSLGGLEGDRGRATGSSRAVRAGGFGNSQNRGKSGNSERGGLASYFASDDEDSGEDRRRGKEREKVREKEKSGRDRERERDRDKEKEKPAGGQREREKDRDREKGRLGEEEKGESAGNLKSRPGLLSAKRSGVAPKEESPDGVRRQGRTNRGTPNVLQRVKPVAASSNLKEPLVVASNVKQVRSNRVSAEQGDRIKGELRKGSVERKPAVRPRRSLAGAAAGDDTGDSDEDQEELSSAVKAAANFSLHACGGNQFWKQVEPYFGMVSSDDLDYLKQHKKDIEEDDPALQVPPCGELLSKVAQRTEALQDEADASPALRRSSSRNTPGDAVRGPSTTLASIARQVAKNGGNGDAADVVTSRSHAAARPTGGSAVPEDDEQRSGFFYFPEINGLHFSQRLLAALIDEDDSDESSPVRYGDDDDNDALDGLRRGGGGGGNAVTTCSPAGMPPLLDCTAQSHKNGRGRDSNGNSGSGSGGEAAGDSARECENSEARDGAEDDALLDCGSVLRRGPEGGGPRAAAVAAKKERAAALPGAGVRDPAWGPAKNGLHEGGCDGSSLEKPHAGLELGEDDDILADGVCLAGPVAAGGGGSSAAVLNNSGRAHLQDCDNATSSREAKRKNGSLPSAASLKRHGSRSQLGSGAAGGSVQADDYEVNSERSRAAAHELPPMSLDERVVLELQGIGLLPAQLPDLSMREDDEVCTEMRQLQSELHRQVQLNKDHITALEATIAATRPDIERLLHMASERRFGAKGGDKKEGNGAAGGKSMAFKGGSSSKQSAIQFAKRVLRKMGDFERGRSCVTDPGLRDTLLCITNRERELVASAVAAAALPATSAGTGLPAAPAPSLVTESPVRMRRSEPRERADKDTTGARARSGAPVSLLAEKPEKSNAPSRPPKEGAGLAAPLPRTKEKIARLEDVIGSLPGGGRSEQQQASAGGGTLIPLANVKRKRSERDADSKLTGASPARKMSAKLEGPAAAAVAAAPRSAAVGVVKDERGGLKSRNRNRGSGTGGRTGVAGSIFGSIEAAVEDSRHPSPSPLRTAYADLSMLEEVEAQPEPVGAVRKDDTLPAPENELAPEIAPELMGMGELAIPDIGGDFGGQTSDWLGNLVDDNILGTDGMDHFNEGLACPMDDLNDLF